MCRRQELLAASAHWIAEDEVDARIDAAVENPVPLWKSKKVKSL